MKKTLVALAVLAASGASFAQVSLTGEFAYGYSASTSGAGATASGGGLDTAQLVFAAGEDLGGGNRVDVKMSTDGTAGRSAAMNMDNQTIALTTGFGKITAGSWKPGNWLAGATGYAVWYGLDGRVLGARGVVDSIGIAVPLTSAISISATAYEPAGLLGEGSGNAGTILQQNNSYGLTYKAGALLATVGYATYNNIGLTDSTTKNVARIGGSYDFGMAKVGAGTAVQTFGDSGTSTQTLVSVSAPIGSSMSVNAGWASNNTSVAAASTLAAAAGNRTGYMLGAQYNMSKRTYAILNYGSWLAAIGDAQNTNVTALTMVHDF
jgi:hypothetical protein